MGSSGVAERTDRVTAAAAIISAVLGLASAGVSAYWALGGDGLLDTVGGDIERWGREREPAVVVILWFIVALKTIVAIAAPVLAGVGYDWLPAWTRSRLPRVLGWIAAVTLTVYGGVLTFVGLLVQADLVNASADADSVALAWHAYLWDPWFVIWGVAFVVALWRSQRGAQERRARRRSGGCIAASRCCPDAAANGRASLRRPVACSTR